MGGDALLLLAICHGFMIGIFECPLSRLWSDIIGAPVTEAARGEHRLCDVHRVKSVRSGAGGRAWRTIFWPET